MEVGMMTDSSGEQSCLSFWNLSTGVRLKSYKNGICGKNGIGFVGNDYILCAQYQKQLIHVYDARKEQLVKKIVCPGKITAMAVSPDGNYCIVALVEKIYVWQVCTGNLLNVLSKHYQTVTCIKFTQDGSFFVTSGDDNLLLVWNFANVLQPKDPLSSSNTCEQPIHTLSQHSMPIQSVYVGINGMRCHIATCSLDQTCKVYNLISGQLLCSFVYDMACTAVAMDCMETRLFTGTVDGKIFIVNCFSQKPGIDNHISSTEVPFINAHSKEVNSLSICMDGTTMLSASLDTSVKLWHIQSKQCLRSFSFKGEITNSAVITYPKFLNHNNELLPSKCDIHNFKRSIYVPGERIGDSNAMNIEDGDMLPVILKDINQNETNTDKVSYLDEALLECMSHSNQSTSNSLKTATRSELIQRINTLESMAQDFYKFASEKLINKKMETS